MPHPNALSLASLEGPDFFCHKNYMDENEQNKINEREEKAPKDTNSNLKTLAIMTEPTVEPVKKIGGALGKGSLKLADSLLVNKL